MWLNRGKCFGGRNQKKRDGWMSVLFIYIVIRLFYVLITAATGAAAPGCSGTGNAAD